MKITTNGKYTPVRINADLCVPGWHQSTRQTSKCSLTPICLVPYRLPCRNLGTDGPKRILTPESNEMHVMTLGSKRFDLQHAIILPSHPSKPLHNYKHWEITFKAFDSIMRLPTLATCWIPPSCSEHNSQLSLRLNTFPAQCSETMERMVWTAWRWASKCTNIAALLLQQQALKIIMHTNSCLIKHAKHVDINVSYRPLRYQTCFNLHRSSFRPQKIKINIKADLQLGHGVPS